ncbi:adenosylcobyric acid synthase [Natronospira proteinivora]|uniref:Cobyric acid synthase n=1 Tax=Natronospira proteinivora TaxID=1807133 RepID=A0ABT1G6C3_9GAMM|nr:cobyric acid synthase [Natronospira proteinivora]MCP1726846.1 adenosylcobyric acid synthase [Natronospira proteinivora]
MSALMIQGTTSDAGKSTVVAALCRWLARQGVSVAPFKPQNMALNSAVTVEGGEIGRSTALQALACGLEPENDMNPVLLKPQTDVGAQVILRGQVHGNMQALDYHRFKAEARETVMAAWQSLRRRYDVIIVEGAGSPAEINLRENDIANMGFAEAADIPVVLVGDIDRGGVFAQLVGTMALLSPSEQARVKGFVINRFRGDLGLLQDGLDWLEEYAQRPVLGVLPYLQDLMLDAEDSVQQAGQEEGDGLFRVVIPALPRMSNHNDFDPLRLHPRVALRFARDPEKAGPADLVILPGSKHTRSDLTWLEQSGWPEYLDRHLRYGGKLLGICGGFQMLGRSVSDPEAVEGEAGETRALSYLDFDTRLASNKTLLEVEGGFLDQQAGFSGYEIHNGLSQGPAFDRPWLTLDGHPVGAESRDGQIRGCYIHGLMDRAEACDALLRWAGLPPSEAPAPDYRAHRLTQLDRLADSVEANLDTAKLHQWLFTLKG